MVESANGGVYCCASIPVRVEGLPKLLPVLAGLACRCRPRPATTPTIFYSRRPPKPMAAAAFRFVRAVVARTRRRELGTRGAGRPAGGGPPTASRVRTRSSARADSGGACPGRRGAGDGSDAAQVFGGDAAQVTAATRRRRSLLELAGGRASGARRAGRSSSKRSMRSWLELEYAVPSALPVPRTPGERSGGSTRRGRCPTESAAADERQRTAVGGRRRRGRRQRPQFEFRI